MKRKKASFPSSWGNRLFLLIFWLFPLLSGLSIFILWLFTGHDRWIFMGVFTFYGGCFLLLLGSGILLFRRLKGKKGEGRRFLLILSNLPVGIGILLLSFFLLI
ncbi:MAG: hypothetical protein PQJ60_06195 [Spirochaetales bacterium]|nr:hypothetical protein [Spirochaetales bacterium]